MKVKELVEKLQKFENQDASVQIFCGENHDLEDVYGFSISEEKDNLIICDQDTFEGFN